MRRIVPLLGLAALVSCTTPPPQVAPTISPNPIVTPAVSAIPAPEQLKINETTNFQVISKGFEEGIRDIRAFNAEAEIEEAFIYDVNTKTWYEVGELVLPPQFMINRNSPLGYEFMMGINGNVELIEKIMANTSSLVYVHNHPEQHPQEVAFLTNQNNTKPEDVQKMLHIRDSLPSAQDLEHYLNLNKRYAQINPAGIMTSVIVSYEGLTKMEGRPKPDYIITPDPINTLSVLRGTIDTRVVEMLIHPSSSPDALKDSLFRGLESPHVHITFKPYKEE